MVPQGIYCMAVYDTRRMRVMGKEEHRADLSPYRHFPPFELHHRRFPLYPSRPTGASNRAIIGDLKFVYLTDLLDTGILYLDNIFIFLVLLAPTNASACASAGIPSILGINICENLTAEGYWKFHCMETARFFACSYDALFSIWNSTRCYTQLVCPKLWVQHTYDTQIKLMQ